MRNLIYIIASISLLLLGSCTEKIDIDLGSTYTRLVVQASLSNDTAMHTVILSRTTDYYEPSTENIYISGASVSITEGDHVFYLKEDSIQKGHYHTASTVYGESGKTYTLQINGVDINKDGETESYTATAIMPYIADQIDSVKGVYGRGMPPFFSMYKTLGWNILLYAADPPTKEYYVFFLSINGEIYNNNIRNYNRMPDDFTQGLYIAGISIFFIQDNEPIALKVGDTIGIEAWSITAGYNQYISDVQDALNSSLPIFGSTPANVRGNISNGAIGYFAVYANKRAHTILKPVAEVKENPKRMIVGSLKGNS